MRQPKLTTAQEISEYLLKVTADALLQQDFESLAAVFALPHVMTTASSEIRLYTRDDLRTTFDQMCQHYQSLDVTDLQRVCEAAAFYGPDEVRATHTSHVISHGREVTPAFPVYSVLRRHDGNWKIMSSDYALGSTDPMASALTPATNRNTEARLIYQRHLDRATDAMMRKDFEAFRRVIALPQDADRNRCANHARH
ncbi:hypothetical protein ACJ5NV_00080 [Loktanella agnita]|uniref:hypothetical protein n=1 Tax=Loktanella agnita TaxID=287097 RepID=UPI003985EEA1